MKSAPPDAFTVRDDLEDSGSNALLLRSKQIPTSDEDGSERHCFPESDDEVHTLEPAASSHQIEEAPNLPSLRATRRHPTSKSI